MGTDTSGGLSTEGNSRSGRSEGKTAHGQKTFQRVAWAFAGYITPAEPNQSELTWRSGLSVVFWLQHPTQPWNRCQVTVDQRGSTHSTTAAIGREQSSPPKLRPRDSLTLIVTNTVERENGKIDLRVPESPDPTLRANYLDCCLFLYSNPWLMILAIRTLGIVASPDWLNYGICSSKGHSWLGTK